VWQKACFDDAVIADCHLCLVEATDVMEMAI